MSGKKRMLITPEGGLFRLPDFFDVSLDDRDKELLSMRFMLHYNETNFIDSAIPSLAALLSLGNLKLIVVDGYSEPVWFRSRVVIATLIRNILPEQTTLKLLDQNTKYIQVDSRADMNEMFIKFTEEAEKEEFDIIDLRETEWYTYITKEFPELYPPVETDDTDDNRH